jgi:hypothetical protein
MVSIILIPIDYEPHQMRREKGGGGDRGGDATSLGSRMYSKSGEVEKVQRTMGVALMAVPSTLYVCCSTLHHQPCLFSDTPEPKCLLLGPALSRACKS